LQKIFALQSIEIMSPVGSYESLMAALQGGAGSVYFGVGKLNMRSRSSANFTLDDLKKIASLCNKKGVKTYITLNTIIFDNELDEMHHIVDAAKENGITAIIASDLSVLEYARQQGVEVHISTQCNITNTEAVKFYSQYADVMVTARELNLEQVAAIIKNIKEQNICGPSGKQVRIEIFCHGALCMAISGKCYLSLDNFHASANRGACLQPCRRSYVLTDKEEGYQIEVDHDYLMSPKDLKTIGFLDKILHAGVSVLKIEGRGRSADYVKTVTRCYREAVDAYFSGEFTSEHIARWDEQLKTVYNRDFWDGYYLGRKMGEWTEQYGSQATQTKVYVGKINNYFSKLHVAEIKIETQTLNVGDEYKIIGSTTGVLEGIVEEIRLEDKCIATAGKGDVISMPVPGTVRRADKLYKIISNF